MDMNHGSAKLTDGAMPFYNLALRVYREAGTDVVPNEDRGRPACFWLDQRELGWLKKKAGKDSERSCSCTERCNLARNSKRTNV